ncbi:hypothetical protein SAMN05216167_1582 [Spirosoma endophyticum]|uniref:Uncharacterized protein n=1 Tax=Spirosoma endophyticum TaxID=662367 RepID=A0A1I2IAP6_9BACT|nr:hypothetical protein SAMN05216167_1582 [Spirosoma endophyticum]
MFSYQLAINYSLAAPKKGVVTSYVTTPFLTLGKLCFLKMCCIRIVMLREYSKINHPTEAVNTNQIALWKRSKKTSTISMEYL